MNRVVVGVGSNIDPEANVIKARGLLAEEQNLITSSEFERTPPVGRTDQPWFLNGAFLIETPLRMDELKIYLRSVEKRLGRIRISDKYASRTIDLDILVWNGTIVDLDVHKRSFLQRAVSQVLNGTPTGNREGQSNENRTPDDTESHKRSHP